MALQQCDYSLIPELEPSLNDDLTLTTLICCPFYVVLIDLLGYSLEGYNHECVRACFSDCC